MEISLPPFQSDFVRFCAGSYPADCVLLLIRTLRTTDVASSIFARTGMFISALST